MRLVAELVVNYTELALLAMIVIAGYGALYYTLHRQFQRTIDNLRGEWAEEISSLRVASRLKREPSSAVESVPVPAPAKASAPSTPPPPPPAKRQEVSPETLLVIAAAVTAFLGKKVRIRSAKELYLHESFNSWSQQGRAVIQASHNVAQRVH